VRVPYDERVANHIHPEKGLAALATGHVLAVWETGRRAWRRFLVQGATGRSEGVQRHALALRSAGACQSDRKSPRNGGLRDLQIRRTNHAFGIRLEWLLVLGTLAILALQRHVKTLEQAVVVKWLGEEAACTCLQDTRTNPLLGKSGDEDDGHAVTARV
jgi:hypothetical protein